MYFSAKERSTVKTHLKIVKIVDGDSMILSDLFNVNFEKVRLLGIDAPESCKSRKLNQDEREQHLAGNLLIELGILSFRHLSNYAHIGDNVTLKIEKNNAYDIYGRTLAYVYLSNSICLNEMMICDGYAKPNNKYFCNELNNYQLLNVTARTEKKGLYSLVDRF